MTSLVSLWRKKNHIDSFLHHQEDNLDVEVMEAADGEWRNHADEVFRQELGVYEYKKRHDQQNKLFQKACQDGTIMKNVAISIAGDRFRPTLGMTALRMKPEISIQTGIGAAGFAVIERNPLLPDNNFFVPGRLFEVRIIHSNFPDASDDAVTGVRTLGIKFSDHHKSSPFDLMCHTGYISPFFNADSVYHYIQGHDTTDEERRKYLLTLPAYLRSHIDGVRYLPDSYYHQNYHAQMVYDFYSSDNVHRLARFRVVPADGSSESGRLSTDMQKQAWITGRPEGASHPKDYLKSEFSDRLCSGAVDYILQVQLHEPHGHQCHMMYNTSLPWEETLHPWINVARVSLTRQLPDDVISLTRFHIGNLPSCINIPEPRSSDDFNIVSQILKDGCDTFEQAHAAEPKEVAGDVTEYIIHVVTGDKKHAGTDADIAISIIGQSGCTSYRNLVTRMQDDYEKNRKNTFVVEDKPVGEFLCAKIHVTPKSEKSDWYLAYVTIDTSYNGKCYKLPVYRWFSKTTTAMTLRDGTAFLASQEKSPYLRLHRRIELQDRQMRYEWIEEAEENVDGDELPGHLAAGKDISLVPQDVLFDGMSERDEEWKEFLGKLDEVSEKIKQGWSTALAFIRRLKPLDQYTESVEDLASALPTLKHVIENWQNDEEFARQILNGPNPMKLQQIVELPENFQVTEEMVEDYLEPGRTLQGEIQAGKMYLISYPELQDYANWTEGRQRFLCAPMCLLYVRYGTLVPLAIQLTTTPDQTTPIFTKKDNKGDYSDWMMAKMWVRVADTNLHQLSVHLLGSYLLLEPVAIALLRQLPSVHPVFKLLFPPLRYVVAVNTLWRKVLYSVNGALSQVLALGEKPGEHISFMASQYRNFRFPLLYLPDNLVDRGLMDEDKLPGFYYRDDGLKVWDAVNDFVMHVITIYYKTDTEVERDEELGKFLLDLKANGYHRDAGLPDKFISREELVRFLTIVLFRASAQRSAVSRGQLEVFAFGPNSPPFMLSPVPTSKQKEGIDSATFRSTMPPIEICQHFTEMCRLFKRVDKHASRLGEYPERYFTEEKTQVALRQFRERLMEITRFIEERNITQAAMYSSLIPEKIKSSYGY